MRLKMVSFQESWREQETSIFYMVAKNKEIAKTATFETTLPMESLLQRVQNASVEASTRSCEIVCSNCKSSSAVDKGGEISTRKGHHLYKYLQGRVCANKSTEESVHMRLN